METTFPLSTLESQEHFSATVEIAIPLRIFRILEVSPHIVMYLLKPLKALLVAGELVSFKEADCRFEMHPPELLVPFKLLHRSSLDVLEIEDSAEFLVPTELNYTEGNLDTFVDESLVVSADTEASRQEIHSPA